MAEVGQTDDYGANPIPMAPEQLSLLLDNISKLDVERCILEPGVILAETQTLLNLSVIRSKVSMPGYTLPEMLMDLNSICEPFLNQSPSHAEYAKVFLENANEEIVKAVQDAQVVVQQQDQPVMQNGQVQHGGHANQSYVQQGGYSDYQSQAMPHHNGMMPHQGVPHQPAMSVASYHPGTPSNLQQQTMIGRKRPNSAPGGSTLPRTRVEGRRCEVCAVIKKAGCGTENAHFRCLKRKRPEGSQELEAQVRELVDVGQEERVTVWNPKEGRKLSGQAAPMLKNLVGWLASHPGWEAHPRGASALTKRGPSSEPQLGPPGLPHPQHPGQGPPHMGSGFPPAQQPYGQPPPPTQYAPHMQPHHQQQPPPQPLPQQVHNSSYPQPPNAHPLPAHGHSGGPQHPQAGPPGSLPPAQQHMPHAGPGGPPPNHNYQQPPMQQPQHSGQSQYSSQGSVGQQQYGQPHGQPPQYGSGAGGYQQQQGLPAQQHQQLDQQAQGGGYHQVSVAPPPQQPLQQAQGNQPAQQGYGHQHPMQPQHVQSHAYQAPSGGHHQGAQPQEEYEQQHHQQQAYQQQQYQPQGQEQQQQQQQQPLSQQQVQPEDVPNGVQHQYQSYQQHEQQTNSASVHQGEQQQSEQQQPHYQQQQQQPYPQSSSQPREEQSQNQVQLQQGQELGGQAQPGMYPNPTTEMIAAKHEVGYADAGHGGNQQGNGNGSVGVLQEHQQPPYGYGQNGAVAGKQEVGCEGVGQSHGGMGGGVVVQQGPGA